MQLLYDNNYFFFASQNKLPSDFCAALNAGIVKIQNLIVVKKFLGFSPVIEIYIFYFSNFFSNLLTQKETNKISIKYSKIKNV